MAEQIEQKCPDDGTCHHLCTSECFRRMWCGPLSGVYPNDMWPTTVTTAPIRISKP